MGVTLPASLVAAILFAVTPTAYVESRQASDGGFGDPQITAWATLGLAAAGSEPERLRAAAAYLASREGEAQSTTDLALSVMARSAAGQEAEAAVARLRSHRPGRLVNATIWTILALRQVGEPAPDALVGALRRAQHRSGGWPWHAGGAPDTNDTAAAIQALRAAGVGGRPIQRAVVFLRRHQNADGGFELTPGRGSDAQSTAWAIQALLAAGRLPGAPAFRYLARLQRPDGSYRYSARYATTPLWVTAQVLPALARKPFPLPR
jgi:Squalene-hopene cyclase C-terminal domain/Prenyltransferase and squalene oxidase repeat